MKFFPFKKKSIQRFFDKELTKQSTLVKSIPISKIKKVAVLLEEAVYCQNQIIRQIEEMYGIQRCDVHLLVYCAHDKKRAYKSYEFSEKSFGWSGSLKLNSLQEFVKIEYDLFINYGFAENLYMKVITLSSQSHFKIGFSSEDNRMYDLSIADSEKRIDTLNEEAVKYLKILKKL
jgi:hypothetical protein